MDSATGLLTLNLGGPATLDDVKPFLESLFSDREIIRLPGGRLGQRFLSRMIVRARLNGVIRNYRSIGGGSPIFEFTRRQTAQLCRELERQTGRRFKPYIAFRYTEPRSDTAVQQMRDDGITDAIVLTLYPHFSNTTTGSSLRDLERALARQGAGRSFNLRFVDRWYNHPGYLDVMAAHVERGLATWPEYRRRDVVLLFSAHSLPMSFIEDGDPYPEHVHTTVDGILKRLGGRAPRFAELAYQSQTGPVRWLEPRTDRVLERLGREGAKDVLVVPVSFVSDHIETLYEVDQLFAAIAAKAGITNFRRIDSLNDDPAFISALADIVRVKLALKPVEA